MDEIIKQSFTVNLTILRGLALYPPENPTCLYKAKSYIMYFLFIIVNPFLTVLYFAFEEDTDMMQKSVAAIYLAEACGFTLKLLPFITQPKRVKKIIHYFEDSLFEVFNNEQKKIMDDVVWNCRRNSSAFCAVIIGAVVNWAVRPLFLKNSKFPIDMWLPFDATTDPKIYYCVYLFSTTALFYAALSTIVDPLFGGLAYYAAGQLKILKINLQQLNTNAEEKIRKNYDSNIDTKAIKFEIIYRKIKQCIQHHNAVVNFVKEFENCFSWGLFSQLVTSVFIIGLVCQRLGMIKELDYYAYTYMLFISGILGQIYFYCYYGTILAEESDSLTTAIYMCNWYEFDLKSKKALILFMERSQKQLTLTAGKLLPLSMETFTTILRRSYSLIAVLKNF